jgi:hypothetical protein
MKTVFTVLLPAAVNIIRNKGINIEKYLRKNDGFGLNEFLGVAAAVIIAGFIIIPGLQSFSEGLIEDLGDWWSDIATEVFEKSPSE